MRSDMGYSQIKVGDTCELVNGCAYKSKDFTESGVPVIKIANVKPGKIVKDKIQYVPEQLANEHKKQLVQYGDILLTMTGNRINGTPDSWVGKAAIFKENNKYTLNQRVCALRADSSIIEPYFLGYVLSSWESQLYFIKRSTSSGGQANISPDTIKNYCIPYPARDIQKKIVRILSALDQKIELNNRLISSLYSLGDAFYEKIQSGNSKTVTLKDVSINYDKKRIPLSSRQREERRGEFPYYGATSILDYVDDYLFDGEYILLGEDGTVMTDKGGAVLQYIWGKNWVNNHAHVLQGSEVSTEYLLFALRSVNVSALVTGAVQPKINQENMNKIKLSIGSENKMAKVEESIKTIAAQIRNLTDENKSLLSMRDTLLPKLMSGEINLDKVTI